MPYGCCVGLLLVLVTCTWPFGSEDSSEAPSEAFSEAFGVRRRRVHVVRLEGGFVGCTPECHGCVTALTALTALTVCAPGIRRGVRGHTGRRSASQIYAEKVPALRAPTKDDQ